MTDFNLNSALAAVAARNAENPPSVAIDAQIDPGSPRERIARARQQEADIIQQLAWMQEQPDSDLKTRRINAWMDRIAELAAEQGDYARAAEIAYSPERRAYYESLVAAIAEPNSATCECPPDLEVDPVNRREFRSPAMMLSDVLITPDGGQITLKVCRKCGYQNAS